MTCSFHAPNGYHSLTWDDRPVPTSHLDRPPHPHAYPPGVFYRLLAAPCTGHRFSTHPGYIAWALAMMSHMGYPAWVPATNSRWLPCLDAHSNSCWLPCRGAHFNLLLATPHGCSFFFFFFFFYTPAGCPAWTLTSTSCWLPRVGARSKLPLAYPSWALATNSHCATPPGRSLQTHAGYPAWAFTSDS